MSRETRNDAVCTIYASRDELGLCVVAQGDFGKVRRSVDETGVFERRQISQG